MAACRDEAANPHPVLRYYLLTGSRQPCQVADVPDRIADRAMIQAWYGLHRDWDSVVPHQLAVPLRLDAGAGVRPPRGAGARRAGPPPGWTGSPSIPATVAAFTNASTVSST